MANEWTKVELEGSNNDGGVRRYTIADGTSVSKGALLALSDPRTAGPSTGALAPYCGVASEEHLANVGVTTISCWTNGIFSVTASEAIGIGVDLSGAENNTVTESIAAASGAQIIGYSLEEATAGGTFTMRLRL